MKMEIEDVFVYSEKNKEKVEGIRSVELSWLLQKRIFKKK